MADIGKLRTWVESIGVAVRAGVLTPSMDDERYIRAQFGLPDMNADVEANWKSIGGVRAPITLAEDEPPQVAQAPAETGPKETPDATE